MRIRPRVLVFDLAVLLGCAAAVWCLGSVTIRGASMAPTLAPGDVVVFRKAPVPVAKGDVVVLGEPGHRFVHRVIERRVSGTIVTQGDANPIPDLEPTSTAAVRGKVVAVLPFGRLVARLASSGGRARLWSQSDTER